MDSDTEYYSYYSSESDAETAPAAIETVAQQAETVAAPPRRQAPAPDWFANIPAVKQRKPRISKVQAEAFMQWLQGHADNARALSAAKIAKRYKDETGIEVSRMFALKGKRTVIAQRAEGGR